MDEEKSPNRHTRKADRIEKERYKSLRGAISICERCGEAFHQVWREERHGFTQFKKCKKCLYGESMGKRHTKEPVITAKIEYEPHEKQKLIHASDARFKVICAGARFGKDRCSIMEFIEKFASMLSEDRGPEMVPTVHAWLIAPTFAMARQSWRELKAYFPKVWTINTWESDKMIETIYGGMIEVRSADDPQSLVGVGLDIVLITEAARISGLEEVWSNLETRLMSPGRGPGGKGGIALVNSTPRGSGTYYHRMYRWGQKDDPMHDYEWESWRFSTWDNPYLEKGDQDYINRIKKRYPERVYRQEILAEFIADGNSVFPRASDCIDTNLSADVEMGERYVIGYDPARSMDYSGVVIRNTRGEVVYVAQWTGKPWTQQMKLIESLSKEYNNAVVVVDRTGLGNAIPEALEQRGLEVDAVYFTAQEKERLVNHLAMLIEQRLIKIPDYYPLLAELRDYQYTTTKTGHVRYGAASSGHDDLVTALFLSMSHFNAPQLTSPYMGLLDGIKTY